MFKKTLCTLIAVAASCALFTGCGNKNANKLESIKKAGKLVAYTNPEFPPYQYAGKDGEIAGVEMDIVRRIADKLGVKAEIVSAEFDSIIGTVQTGKADMAASGITINEERKKQVDFSIPFVSSVQYLVVPENSPIKSVEDLAGKQVGGQQGTTGYIMVEDAIIKGILKGSKAVARAYNNAPDAVTAMKEDKVQAVVIDELVAMSLAASNPGYKAIKLLDKNGKPLDAPEEFGIAIAKGNAPFMKVINDTIAEMKKDGSLAASMKKHNEIAAVLAKEKDAAKK